MAATTKETPSGATLLSEEAIDTSYTPKMKILPELQKYLRPLDKAEFAYLEEQILADGCLPPLTIWDEENVLLDGHHRYKICQKHGLTWKEHRISLPSLTDAKMWMVKQQAGRRNLSETEKLILTREYQRLIAVQAAENKARIAREQAIEQRKSAVCNFGEVESEIKLNLETVVHIDSMEEAAKTFGLSRYMVNEFNLIMGRFDIKTGEDLPGTVITEIKEQILAGNISYEVARRLAKTVPDKEMQKQIYNEAMNSETRDFTSAIKASINTFIDAKVANIQQHPPLEEPTPREISINHAWEDISGEVPLENSEAAYNVNRATDDLLKAYDEVLSISLPLLLKDMLAAGVSR